MKKSLLIFAVVVFLMEMAGVISGYVAPGLYDHVQDALNNETAKPYVQKQFNGFLRYSFSPLTEWRTKTWFSGMQKDCTGVAHRYSYGAYSERTYTGYDPSKVQVMLVGDSLVLGPEIGDDETIAAGIYRNTGIVSANLGGGGYDAVQSFLRATSSLRYFPATKAVVLGIMYDDINRIANSYRASYLNDPALFNLRPVELFNLKPYMKDGQLHPLNLDAFGSLGAFMPAAQLAAKSDYWARPGYRFPYTLALIRALTSHAFIDSALMNYGKHTHHQFEYQYRDKVLADNLFALIKLFSEWAMQHDITPIVVLIPGNNLDISSPKEWLAHYRSRLPQNLVIENLGPNMQAPHPRSVEKKCHTYEQGPQELAAAYSDIIRRYLTTLRALLYPPPASLFIAQIKTARHL